MIKSKVRFVEWQEPSVKTLGEVFDMVGKDGRVAAVTYWPGYNNPVSTYDIEDIYTMSYARDDTGFTLLGLLVQG